MLSDQLKKLKGSPTAKFFRLAKEREAQGHNIVHLEIGQPDFQPLPEVISTTIQAIKEGKTTYTVSSGIPELRNEISTTYKAEYNLEINAGEEIIITSGAKQGILAAIYAVLNHGDYLIVPEPYWVSYPDMTSLAGGNFSSIPMKPDFSLDQEFIKEVISKKPVRALLLNSPNNPTGHLLSPKELSFVKDLTKDHEIMIIADEIYNDYMYVPSTFRTLLTELDNWREKIIVVNGFSKTYSMTGFRLGYSISNKELAKGILRFVQASTSCAPIFCQEGAVVALQNRDQAQKIIQQIFPSRRQLLLREVEKIDGLSINSIDGAFYGFIKYDYTDKPSETVALDILNNANVAVIPGTAFGPSAEGYFRVAFSRSEEEIKEAFKRIKSYIDIDG
ncbi:MAG: pyridoxal phosphate-dependent aminotransferase [Candidatus Hodarchaeales archaeon]|jgi:aspartate/methionine/tyrosine aminotransferase